MHLYWDLVFPRLCDFVMDSPHLAQQRRQLLSAVHGEILEIGVGSGLNLAHYPQSVRKITTIDPSSGMNKLLQKRIARSKIEVEQYILAAETLPFADATYDCVVSTWTLCSVLDVRRAIAELFRVLKAGGRFVFLEHGLSEAPAVQVWQRRLNPLQQFVARCRLDLNFRALFTHPPFASVEIENFYLEHTAKTHGYMYRGVATK